MEIAASAPQTTINSQQNSARAREADRTQLDTNQANARVDEETTETNSNPVEELSESEPAINRNNQQVARPQEPVPSANESIGGQIDIRA